MALFSVSSFSFVAGITLEYDFLRTEDVSSTFDFEGDLLFSSSSEGDLLFAFNSKGDLLFSSNSKGDLLFSSVFEGDLLLSSDSLI